MRKKFVEEMGWIEEQEMLDFTAIAQSTPGAIAVNASILVGQVMHKGICGGWNLITDYNFTPEMLCGLFLFCRYIEKENELLII